MFKKVSDCRTSKYWCKESLEILIYADVRNKAFTGKKSDVMFYLFARNVFKSNQN
jgi:hypothetical protein